MKVKIGPYVDWFGPYQLAEKLCFWAKPVKDEYGIPRKPAWVHNFGEFLATGKFGTYTDERQSAQKLSEIDTESLLYSQDEHKTWLYRLLDFIHSFRNRSVKIKIDKYDTWNMSSTLGLIILPMLKQLKESKQGAPYVSDSDVPERLRSTNDTSERDGSGVDCLHFARWDWVLDEMIFSFEELQKGRIDYRFMYSKGEEILKVTEVDPDGNPTEFTSSGEIAQKFIIDEENLEKYRNRVQNGFALFGKYYQNLWV